MAAGIGQHTPCEAATGLQELGKSQHSVFPRGIAAFGTEKLILSHIREPW